MVNKHFHAGYFQFAIISASVLWIRPANLEHVKELSFPVSCQMNRSLLNNGFHRDLVSELTFLAKDESVIPKDCNVMLQEHLPSGIYLDLYQLTESHNYGGPKVISLTEFDLEKPEYQSLPHTVQVYSRMKLEEVTFHVVISMAIHVRYHRPSNDKEFEQVQIPSPDIFFDCGKHDSTSYSSFTLVAPCVGDDPTNCTWSKMECQEGSQDIVFEIPVGRFNDFILVTAGTISTTVLTTAFLIRTLLRKKTC